MRALIALLLLLTVSIANAATKDCDAACEATRAAQKRTVVGKGQPDAGEVCFRVLMKDPNDAVTATVTYGNGTTYIHTYPKGSAKTAAGGRGLPLFCIPASRLRGAVTVVICDGGNVGSSTLRNADITYLLRVRSVPEANPSCLLGKAVCKARGL